MSSRLSWLRSGGGKSQKQNLRHSYKKLRCRKSSGAGHVYIANCDISDSDEEEILELTKLLPTVHGSTKCEQSKKQKATWHSLYDFVDHQVQQGETLQIISLRYGCKVSELKRANNIISDREFYGLVKVKVPVRAYGLHFEQPAPGPSNVPTASENAEDNGPRVLAVSIAGHINDNNCHDGKRFLQKMDADLTRIRQSLKTQKSSLEEVAKVLGQKRIHPIAQEPIPKGYNWKMWIVLLLIVLLIVPILIVLLAHFK